MKKIYLFLLMISGLLLSSNSFAQQFETEDLISADGYTVDDSNPLITDASQFSSPYSQNDLGSADGGNLADGVLIDEDSGTFWHSYWQGGSVAGGLHYFQVEMTDDLDPTELIAFVFTRRGNADNDHTTAWAVMGTDNPEASKNECEELAYIETPYASKTETLMSTTFERSSYKYLRFYSETQYPSTRGYFHLSEFNIFTVIKKEQVDLVRAETEKLYDKYMAYQDDFYGRTGDQPGDYSEEAVDAFLDALDAYLVLDMNNVDAMNAWCEQIVATYEAIAPTKLPFRGLQSGYYRIKAGMLYNDYEDRYMMGSRADGKIWGIWSAMDPDIPEDNIQALWKITAITDSTYDVVNMYHDGRFLPVTRSANAEMTDDPAAADTLYLAFDAVATDHDEELSYVNIRLNSQPANDYVYLHQGGHSDGAGTNGYLVGWCNTWNYAPRASEWYFEPVEDDEAQEIIDNYADSKDKDKWLAEFKDIVKKVPGMIETAKDVQKLVEEDKPLITDVAQLSSPWTDPSEGAIANLIDNNTGTFWHSSWHSDPPHATMGDHYLEVAMPEDYYTEEVNKSLVFRVTRRDTNNNHPTKWAVYGTDETWEEGDYADLYADPQADRETCTLLAEIETPLTSIGQSSAKDEVQISDVFDPQGFKYLRFYVDGTESVSGGEHNAVFWHAAEFQLYPGQIYQSPTNQYAVLGNIATELEALVAQYAEFEDEDFQDLDYDNDYLPLKRAYEAFMNKYVDPAALRTTIAQNEKAGDKVVVGTNPGFWPDSSTKDALATTIAAAKAYDAAGAYTPEQSDEFIATIEANAKAIDEAPINKVKEGKWYRLRFGTEEEYDKYGWSKTGNEASYIIDTEDPEDPDTLGFDNTSLYGRYWAVAKRVDVYDENDDELLIGHEIVSIDKADVRLNQSIHAIDLNKLEDPDMALFRFVNVGDSAFAIQNKATGLFIHHDVYLSVQPGLFTQTISGYGENAFFNKTVEGNDKSPLHMARNNNVLCAWGNNSGSGWTDSDGRRGSFFIEEVEDVAADYAFGDFTMKFTPGDIYGRCFPVPVTLKSTDVTLWTVSNVERTPATEDTKEQVKVTLVKIDPAVPAGRPFFFVADGDMPASDAVEGEDYDPVIANLSFTFDLVNAPLNDSYLKGVFDNKKISERFLTTGSGHEEAALEWKAADSQVDVNRVYITDIAEGAEPFARTAELAEIVFNAEGQDGIQAALENLTKNNGAIYSIDGRLVGNGNLNTISKLGRGVYIFNGAKVTVK